MCKKSLLKKNNDKLKNLKWQIFLSNKMFMNQAIYFYSMKIDNTNAM